MSLLKKLVPVFISVGLFLYVLNFIAYPRSWTEASIFQILIFFLPLLFFFSFLFNILFDYFPRSFALSLGILVLILLQALDQFNPLTILVTILATLFLTHYFQKPLFISRRKGGIIPKL